MSEKKTGRRDFLRTALHGGGMLALGAALGALARAGSGDTVWQIDPHACIQCGRCATSCVLTPSAVKCVHGFAMCGRCELCTGYFELDARQLDTGAENQLCPTGAIRRGHLEDVYYDYIVDEPLCIGCGKCVEGCRLYGNGSLYLQIRHDRCVDCNECAIARDCPARAISRVPARQPYLLKQVEENGE